MKLRKKLEKRKETQSNINEIYLRKLSIELIRRGISNNEIRKLLDEVAISLDEFISETKPKNIDNLEEKFGTVEQFCDNNMLFHSKEGALGQTIYSIFITLSILVVPFLGFASFFIYPYNFMILGFKERLLGVTTASLGNGFIGTLFGLNIFTWMLYHHFKNRFSVYDFREKIKTVILFLYWLIFTLWLVLAILPYAMFASVITEIWQEGFQFLILNSATRWIALGLFLGLTATLYTFRFRNVKRSNPKNHSKGNLIDNLKICFIFFILIGFVDPNPGIGLLLILIGIQLLLFARITGGTWIVGGIAVITQITGLLLTQERLFGLVHLNQIVFGLKFESGRNAYRIIFISIIIASVILVTWTILCLYKIRKRKEKILPRFSFPKKKADFLSILLLCIIMFAVLGSKPQYTFISSEIEAERDLDFMGYLYTFTYTYIVPVRGTIYISIYTYIEYNGSLFEETKFLEGTWSVRYEYDSRVTIYYEEDGILGSEPNVTHRIKDWKIGLSYFELKSKNRGIIEVILEYDLATIALLYPEVNLIWIADIPQFPSFIEIVITTIVLISLFLTWEKKKVIKPTYNSKEERR